MRYVRWFWEIEDVWGYDEIDDEYVSWRRVEYSETLGIYSAAASLAETLNARDESLDALVAYEHLYGIAPEGTIVEPEEGLTARYELIPPEEFERIWQAARLAREEDWGPAAGIRP